MIFIKTKLINESTQEISCKGLPHYGLKEERLLPKGELTIKVDAAASYFQWDVRDATGRPIGIGFDECIDSEEITLYETPNQETRWRTSKSRGEAPTFHDSNQVPSENLQDFAAFHDLGKNVSSKIESIEISCGSLRKLLNQAKVCPSQCQNLVQTCLEGTMKMKETYYEMTENDRWQLYYSKKLRQLIGPLNRLLSTLVSIQDLLKACGSHCGKMGLALSISPSERTTVSKFHILANELSWNLDTIYCALHLANEMEFQWNENTSRYVLGKKKPNPSLITRVRLIFVTQQATAEELELEKSEKLAREKLVREDCALFLSLLRKTLIPENFDSSLAREQTSSRDLASVLEKRLQLEEISVLPNNCRSVLEDFRINHLDLKIGNNEKKIAKGGSKSIYKGEWCGQAVAIAVTKDISEEHVIKEALVMLKIQHPNVVDFLGWGFVDPPSPVDAQMPADDAPLSVHSKVFRPSAGYIVMELMQGDLWRLIEQRTRSKSGSPFPIDVAVDILLQMALAMVHMHSVGYMHRDLKAANFLVNLVSSPLESNSQVITANSVTHQEVESYTVKLIDFGSSKLLGADDAIPEHTVNTGTRRWMAPEVWGMPGTLAPYRRSADVYSFGMVCYEVVTGLKPFDPYVNNTQIKQALDLRKRPSLPASVSCPEGLKQLMSKCWAQKESARPDFKYILKELWTIKTELELQ